jgi:Transposase
MWEQVSIGVSVPPDRDGEPIRRFEAFSRDLHDLADWLKACGIETVAMESTGVYWIPLFEILEERGFDVHLVNATHLQNVAGRKADWDRLPVDSHCPYLRLVVEELSATGGDCDLKSVFTTSKDVS